VNDPPVWWRAFATPQFAVTVLMIGLAAYGFWAVLNPASNFSVELKAAAVTAVVISGLGELRKFWLNSTNDSDKKNDTIATLASNQTPNQTPSVTPLGPARATRPPQYQPLDISKL
jgi:hypothetical protein